MDAINSPNANGLPPSASDYPGQYACGSPSLVFSLTVAGTDGQHNIQVITVSRELAPPPTPTPTPTDTP